MELARRTQLFFLALLAGAVVLFAMTVYPFDYGPLGSLAAAGLVVGVVVVEFVLDEATF